MNGGALGSAVLFGEKTLPPKRGFSHVWIFRHAYELGFVMQTLDHLKKKIDKYFLSSICFGWNALLIYIWSFLQFFSPYIIIIIIISK